MSKNKVIAQLGCRLNPVDDQDIIADIARFSDKTSRLKEVYRKVLALEQGGFTVEAAAMHSLSSNAVNMPDSSISTTQKEELKKKGVLVWDGIPKEPTVRQDNSQAAKKVTPANKADLVKKNLLNNGF